MAVPTRTLIASDRVNLGYYSHLPGLSVYRPVGFRGHLCWRSTFVSEESRLADYLRTTVGDTLRKSSLAVATLTTSLLFRVTPFPSD